MRPCEVGRVRLGFPGEADTLISSVQIPQRCWDSDSICTRRVACKAPVYTLHLAYTQPKLASSATLLKKIELLAGRAVDKLDLA